MVTHVQPPNTHAKSSPKGHGLFQHQAALPCAWKKITSSLLSPVAMPFSKRVRKKARHWRLEAPLQTLKLSRWTTSISLISRLEICSLKGFRSKLKKIKKISIIKIRQLWNNRKSPHLYKKTTTRRHKINSTKKEHSLSHHSGGLLTTQPHSHLHHEHCVQYPCEWIPTGRQRNTGAVKWQNSLVILSYAE